MTTRRGQAKKGIAMRMHLRNEKMSLEARNCLENEFNRELESHAGGAPKMHPAHTVTDHGIEIGPIGYGRNLDGTKRS
jgi:hypothetical protein